ncbi:MAG: hypothetical protein ISS26_08155, partial [Candidatus Omnitrophica bacterium]|nr:hypothetical protein [Candidatus Omnitrophota bacterium]
MKDIVIGLKKKIRPYIPVIVFCIVLVVIVIIPLKIISYGFLPGDDAMRHSAKVVSGKGWDQILVMRDVSVPDNHPGWHMILGLVHAFTGWGTDRLVVFSIVFLFILFSLIPIFFLKRPEAWLAVLLAFTVSNITLVWRLFLGRPYIITMSMLLIFCFSWRKLSNKDPRVFCVILAMMAVVSTYVHGSWYLFALPVIALFIARQWRAGIVATVSIGCGILIGALLTGNAYPFLKQNIMHMRLALGSHTLKRMLVGEFQPFSGDPMTVAVVFAMLAWRSLRGAWNRKVFDNPVFILMVLGWVLGFSVRRFWYDWGMPALVVWMALEFQDVFGKISGFFSWKRIALTLAIGGALYLAITNDANGIWTQNITKEYLSADDIDQGEWLPEPGGVIYSDDMTIFYDTFYKNPNAPWRYILGFEAAIMPEEDLAIFRNIQWNHGAYQAFEPWVKKMDPGDRLILKRSFALEPNIPGLEWHYAASDIWIGRPYPNKERKKAMSFG